MCNLWNIYIKLTNVIMSNYEALDELEWQQAKKKKKKSLLVFY